MDGLRPLEHAGAPLGHRGGADRRGPAASPSLPETIVELVVTLAGIAAVFFAVLTVVDLLPS